MQIWKVIESFIPACFLRILHLFSTFAPEHYPSIHRFPIFLPIYGRSLEKSALPNNGSKRSFTDIYL